MKTWTVCFILALVALSVGCSEETSVQTDPDAASAQPAVSSETALDQMQWELVIDPSTFLPQTCTGSTDPTCNEQGDGQRKVCDVDMLCRLYRSDDHCVYPDNDPLQCAYTPCGGDADCENQTVDAENYTSECVFTTNSFLSDPGGICAWWYKPCSVLVGTPCETTGVKYPSSEGEWVCSAQANMDAASPETCDGVDNDCDGSTDETFTTLASACDGTDSDSCMNGTHTCAADGLGVECVNEILTNIAETCNGQDDDCDSDVDELFPELGMACDGTDSDSCMNGTYTCAADGLGVECASETQTNIAETCNSLDDDCDGQADEDFSELGMACDGTDSDSCMNGTYTCAADGLGVECASETQTNIAETCNGQDDDCDGQVDEGVQTKFYADKDGDKCAKATDGEFDDVQMACTAPEGYITADQMTCDPQVGDCNDNDPNVYSGASETCNSVDDDCDGPADENFLLGVPCTAGNGVCKTSGTFVCQLGGLSSSCSAAADMTQSSAESCNGLDDDCDGATDEGCDDDNDDWCDASMAYSAGAACAQGDCDDTNPATNLSGNETCNGVDDNCNGAMDDDCDNDNDGFCDVGIAFVAGAACLSGDCDDNNGAVHPQAKESCLTAYDDNCDGDTVHLADGVTLACDSCAAAVKLPCNVETPVSLGELPNGFNSIQTYNCMTNVGPKTIGKTLSGPEAILVPDAPAGEPFSFTIKSTGLGAYAALLHGSCDPDEGTSGVTAFKDGSAEYDGTCAAYGITSVKGGIVGEHYVSLDAPSALTLTVKFTCDP